MFKRSIMTSSVFLTLLRVRTRLRAIQLVRFDPDTQKYCFTGWYIPFIGLWNSDFLWRGKKIADAKIIFFKHIGKTTFYYAKMLFTCLPNIHDSWLCQTWESHFTSFHPVDQSIYYLLLILSKVFKWCSRNQIFELK